MAAKIERAPGPAWWGQSAIAGLIGGAAMAVVTMIWTFYQGNGFWWPLNVVGAAVPAFRPPVVGFDAAASVTGLVLHLAVTTVLGLIYGAIAALLFPRVARNWAGATLLGLGYGAAAWAIAGAWIAPMVNPFMILVPMDGFLVAHLVFGVVTALVLCAFTRNRRLAVTFAPEAAVVEERPRMGPMV